MLTNQCVEHEFRDLYLLHTIMYLYGDYLLFPPVQETYLISHKLKKYLKVTLEGNNTAGVVWWAEAAVIRLLL